MKRRDRHLLVSATMATVAFAASAVAGVSGATPPASASAAIGVFLATSGAEAADAGELRRGAEIAVQECGAECALVAAANAGQWSAGAGELVRLVYNDGITAVLGAADGRTAHLAEQVVARAKGRFLLLSPWATDPTLTRIRVPWFFRLAPDDVRQAEALSGAMRGRVRKVAVVVAEASYDCRTAAEAFEKIARAGGALEVQRIVVKDEAAEMDALAGQVRATAADAVLVLVPPDTAAAVVRRLRQAGIAARFFGPLRLAAPAFLEAAGDAADGMVLAAPADAVGDGAKHFRDRYRQTHHREPSVLAAYGYDSAAVLVAALRANSGRGGESLRAALASTHRDGLTGRIDFDAAGNRAGPAPLARVEHGRLHPIHELLHSPVLESTTYDAPRSQ